MRIVISFLLFLLVGRAIAQQSPIFQRVSSSTDNAVHDTKEWSLFTGGPVRATPLVKAGFIYIGNARGDFYAIEKKSGSVKWKYSTGEAIHSSAIGSGGKIYFTDNRQTVYALEETSGKLAWKYTMDKKLIYPWRYDYYHSSPVLADGKLLVGGEDGFFHAISPATGKLLWKFKSKGIIRSTAAVSGSTIWFGDTEATLYALDLKNGKEKWQYKINGDTMNNADYGFDRRAITSSPVVKGNKVIFGARDGYLYCVDATTGNNIWKVDHRVSWIISTVAIKDTIVVTGTSDGRFVQAIGLESGQEIWRYRTPLAVWASPLIAGDRVYAGGFDGHLFCLDLKTGRRISQYRTNGKILSSPIMDDKLLYVGSDDGNVYAFSGHPDSRIKTDLDKYVFYEPGVNIYFRGGTDMVIRNYLRGIGYKVIGLDSIAHYLSRETANSPVIIFASAYLPDTIIKNGATSIIRRFLDRGGRVVLAGINSSMYKIDPVARQPVAFNLRTIDTIFGIDYGHGDTRTFMGDFPSFPTEAGKRLGLADFWTNSVFIDAKNVDLVLGRNENGDVSAFVKNYGNGGKLVQLWLDPERPDRLDAVAKAAEWVF
ncbi:MAG: PQQ-binding-like beta-propeller repeat protein [Chitinophagaceae bacterium]|nr:PQQ-binding-like beta-propeller repeat protein [Chitinophagaceae bacterium]